MHRIHSLDYLKVLLAIGVVLGHAMLIRNEPIPWAFLVGNGLLRSLVPTFSVLSGYCFFVTYARGRADRWLVGLALIYLFWIAFYAPIWARGGLSALHLAQVLLLGTMHLWYIAGLILAAALLVGFLWLGERTRTGTRPLVAALLACALLATVLAFWSFWRDPKLPMDLTRNGATVIFPFFAVGYLLAGRVRARGLDSLPRARLLWPVVAALFALKLFEAWLGMRAYGVTLESFPEMPFLSYPAAILLFMAVLRTDLPEAPVDLSLWSASIYFLHIFLIFVLRHFSIDSLSAYVLFGVVGPVLAAVAAQRVLPMLRNRRAARRAKVRP